MKLFKNNYLFFGIIAAALMLAGAGCIFPDNGQTPKDVAIKPGPAPENCASKTPRDPNNLNPYFTVSDANPPVGQTIIFDASCSLGDIVKVEWDLDMMKCIDETVPELRLMSADDPRYDATLDKCFTYSAEIDASGLGIDHPNNFGEMIQPYTPTRAGSTRARLRITDSQGRRQTRSLVYSVRAASASETLASLEVHSVIYKVGNSAPPQELTSQEQSQMASLQLPRYPDGRAPHLLWPIELAYLNSGDAWDNYAGVSDRRYVNSIAKQNFVVYADSLQGQAASYSVEVRGKSPTRGEFTVTSTREMLIPPGGNMSGVIFEVPPPTSQLYERERREAETRPGYYLPDGVRIKDGPELEDFRFEYGFPYEITVIVRVRDRSGSITADESKFVYINELNNSTSLVDFAFVPSKWLPSAVLGRGAGDRTNYRQTEGDYSDEYSSEERDRLIRTPAVNNYVLAPGQEFAVFSYFIPRGYSDSSGIFYSEGRYPDYYEVDIGNGAYERMNNNHIGARAPTNPGTYRLRVRASEAGIEDFPAASQEKELVYRVREPLRLRLTQSKNRIKINDEVVFDARQSAGEIQAFSWALEGPNGLEISRTQDKPWDVNELPWRYRFTAAGDYRVILRVYEKDTMLKGDKTLSIKVEDPVEEMPDLTPQSVRFNTSRVPRVTVGNLGANDVIAAQKKYNISYAWLDADDNIIGTENILQSTRNVLSGGSATEALGMPPFNARKLRIELNNDKQLNEKNFDNNSLTVNVPEIICGKAYDPVCGEDNKIYLNRCYAGKNGAAVAAIGECDAVSHAVTNANCLATIEPVCGADHRTYRNKCDAVANGIAIDYETECRPDTICASDSVPVCGTDGITYQNECLASLSWAEVAQAGACR